MTILASNISLLQDNLVMMILLFICCWISADEIDEIVMKFKHAWESMTGTNSTDEKSRVNGENEEGEEIVNNEEIGGLEEERKQVLASLHSVFSSSSSSSSSSSLPPITISGDVGDADEDDPIVTTIEYGEQSKQQSLERSQSSSSTEPVNSPMTAHSVFSTPVIDIQIPLDSPNEKEMKEKLKKATKRVREIEKKIDRIQSKQTKSSLITKVCRVCEDVGRMLWNWVKTVWIHAILCGVIALMTLNCMYSSSGYGFVDWIILSDDEKI